MEKHQGIWSVPRTSNANQKTRQKLRTHSILEVFAAKVWHKLLSWSDKLFDVGIPEYECSEVIFIVVNCNLYCTSSSSSGCKELNVHRDGKLFPVKLWEKPRGARCERNKCSQGWCKASVDWSSPYCSVVELVLGHKQYINLCFFVHLKWIDWLDQPLCMVIDYFKTFQENLCWLTRDHDSLASNKAFSQMPSMKFSHLCQVTCTSST